MPCSNYNTLSTIWPHLSRSLTFPDHFTAQISMCRIFFSTPFIRLMCFSPWKFRNDYGVLFHCITLLQALSHERKRLEIALTTFHVRIDSDYFKYTLIIWVLKCTSIKIISNCSKLKLKIKKDQQVRTVLEKRFAMDKTYWILKKKIRSATHFG